MRLSGTGNKKARELLTYLWLRVHHIFAYLRICIRATEIGPPASVMWMSGGQWRIQKFWEGVGWRKTMYQPRRHLSQMRTTIYQPMRDKVAYWKKSLEPLGRGRPNLPPPLNPPLLADDSYHGIHSWHCRFAYAIAQRGCQCGLTIGCLNFWPLNVFRFLQVRSLCHLARSIFERPIRWVDFCCPRSTRYSLARVSVINWTRAAAGRPTVHNVATLTTHHHPYRNRGTNRQFYTLKAWF